MKLYFSFFALLTVSLWSCKNHYNEMINWTDNIPLDTPIDSVKKLQPDFIVIDWNNPNKSDSIKSFTIIKIKGYSDVLHMTNTLNFVNEKYIGRFARK
jgi:hypothetical protein